MDRIGAIGLHYINGLLKERGVPEWPARWCWHAQGSNLTRLGVDAGSDPFREGMRSEEFWASDDVKANSGNVVGLALLAKLATVPNFGLELTSPEHCLWKSTCDRLVSTTDHQDSGRQRYERMCIFDILDVICIGNFAGPQGNAPSDLYPFVMGKSTPRGTLFEVAEAALGDWMPRRCFRMPSGLAAGSVQDVIASWGAQFALSTPRPVLTYRMFPPITFLMLQSSWRTLAYPAPVALRKGRPNTALFDGTNVADLTGESVDTLFGSDNLHMDIATIADAVRKWSPHVLQAGDDSLEASAQYMGCVATWLDRHAQQIHATQLGIDIDQEKSFGKRSKIKSVALFKMFMLCKFLCNCANLQSVIDTTLSLTMDESLLDLCQATASAAKPSTISKAALAFDMSYVAYWQTQCWPKCIVGALSGQAAVYFSADSSPQFKRDWLITEFTIIANIVAMEAAYQALRALLPPIALGDRGAWQAWCEQLTFETQQELISLTDEVNALLVRHVVVPVGIASRHGSLVHKIHALLHQLFVDLGHWGSVSQLARCITSSCTDQGVESGIHSAPATVDTLKADGFLPEFTTSFAHDGQFGSSSSDVPGAGGSMGSAQAAGTAAAQVLFATCLWVAGPLHIIHNALEMILQQMLHSNKFLRQIRTITGFLKHQGLRELFCKVCLVGESVKYHFLFMRFPEVFVDWRWGSLLKVCDHLLSIKGVSVAHWNGKAMAQKRGKKRRLDDDATAPPRTEDAEGKGAQRDSAEYQTESDPKLMGEVVSDTMFWAFVSMLTLLA